MKGFWQKIKLLCHQVCYFVILTPHLLRGKNLFDDTYFVILTPHLLRGKNLFDDARSLLRCPTGRHTQDDIIPCLYCHSDPALAAGEESYYHC